MKDEMRIQIEKIAEEVEKEYYREYIKSNLRALENMKKRKKNENASNLASIRRAKSMSQLKLSELTGIPNQTLSKYEKGERDINKAQGITLYKIAQALGCSIEDILEI